MPTQTPNWQHLYHWTQVADVHIRFDRAVEKQGSVSVEEWLSEWSVVNPHENDPEKRYRLYTLLRAEPKLVCVPDAAFLLAKDGYRKAYYVEVDRDTTKDARRVAASKSEGYAVLAERSLHKRHFPAANVDPLTVLCIAPTPRRRDALAKAIKDKRGAELWRFAALDDLTSDSFLTEPVFHPCEGTPAAILKSGVNSTPPIISSVQESTP
jgi:hypothetical protein